MACAVRSQPVRYNQVIPLSELNTARAEGALIYFLIRSVRGVIYRHALPMIVPRASQELFLLHASLTRGYTRHERFSLTKIDVTTKLHTLLLRTQICKLLLRHFIFYRLLCALLMPN